MILAMQGELAKARKGEKGIYVFFFVSVYLFLFVQVFFTSSRTNHYGENLTIATTFFSRFIRKRE